MWNNQLSDSTCHHQRWYSECCNRNINLYNPRRQHAALYTVLANGQVQSVCGCALQKTWHNKTFFVTYLFGGVFVILKTSHHPLTHHNFSFVGSLGNNRTSCTWLQPFLGTFAKLGKKKKVLLALSCPPISPSVRPSVGMEKLSSHWTDFHEIWYEGFSKICCENSSSIKIWHK